MIGVLMASFNGRKYIGQQLDSILLQSRKDIRILVSDDCSADGSAELLERYGEEYKGRLLVLHRSFPSGGAADHFLRLLKLMADHKPGREGELEKDLWKYKGLEGEGRSFLEELARSEYFMLSDQDDVWFPYKGQRLLERMRSIEAEEPVWGTSQGQVQPGPVDRKPMAPGTCVPILVHSDLRVVDEELRVIAPSFFAYQKISPDRTRLSQLLVQNNVTGGAVMINRGMLPFLERIPDVCLMHDAWLALIASAFGRIGYVGEALYCYRQHSHNTLGAEKGDSLESVEARIRDGGVARENYRKMFAQAECLLRLYEDRMGPDEKKTLEKFIELPGRSRLEIMYLILRYGFTKNTCLRTLGQMLFMSV